jgi:lipopolysaccharide/colanic/teichoic acid biosynthesis glycosyltransferase
MAWPSPTPAVSAWEECALCDVRARSPIDRALDIAIATTTLVVLFPLMAALATAIRIDSPGPILYRQWRVGLDRRRRRKSYPGAERRSERGFGRPFQIFKFRSMVVDAEKNTGPVWAAKRDPRTTRIGAFMRRTHLDELPQFINVLLGNMTLVGPRPERPELVRELVTDIPDYAVRSRVLPGITGLAQLENGYDDSLDSARRKVALDMSYIRRRTLVFDGQILVATAWIFVQGRQSAKAEDSGSHHGTTSPRSAELRPSADIVGGRLSAISASYSSSNPDLPSISLPVGESIADGNGVAGMGTARRMPTPVPHSRQVGGHAHGHREAGSASGEAR